MQIQDQLVQIAIKRQILGLSLSLSLILILTVTILTGNFPSAYFVLHCNPDSGRQQKYDFKKGMSRVAISCCMLAP
jgi:hypothetical protein